MRDVAKYEEEMKTLYLKSIGEGKDLFKGIVCPRTLGEPCKLCELCKEILFNRSIPKGDPLRVRASSLNAKFRYYSNVIFLANPREVVIFEYGEKIFRQLIAGQMNPVSEWKDFMHPVSGRNLFITKIQGATREQVDYYVEPRLQATKLPDPSVLEALGKDKHNLSNIIQLLSNDTVKPIYQSKLDKKTEVRLLPSWLGPEKYVKFYEKVDYHFNISKEEFEATQKGLLNPVKGLTLQKPAVEKITAGNPVPKDIGSLSSWGIVSEATSMKEEDDQELELEQMGVLTSQIGLPEELPPPACHGEYDETNDECKIECAKDGWADTCKLKYEKELARRRIAKRLQKK